MRWIVCLGVQYLTGFAGAERWSTNLNLAFPFTDQTAAKQIAKQINDQKLGNNKARVEPLS